jgi:hypothetical protein
MNEKRRSHFLPGRVSCAHATTCHRYSREPGFATGAASKFYVRFAPNSDIDCVFRHVRFGPKADIWPDGRSASLSGAGDAHINLAAKRSEIDRFGEKRVSAVLQGLALGLRIAISRDHDHRDVRSNCFGFRQ